MKIAYIEKRFGEKALATIRHVNTIVAEYEAQGFEITLRQLYYQFVARGLLPNTLRDYKNLGNIVNDARLAGKVSWNAIVDRTRNLQGNSHWEGPGDIVEACAKQFQIDKWAGQPNRVEVWVEKDALVGVIERAARALDVSFFSCRGYTSQSELWAAGQRLGKYKKAGQEPVIVHLGDHDPSGKDMTRDIFDRLELFMGGAEVNRIALNMDQITKYNPPPNPAKITDSRARAYMKEFGGQSWELDALDPKVIHNLITKTVLSYRDEKLYKAAESEERHHKQKLQQVANELNDEL